MGCAYLCSGVDFSGVGGVNRNPRHRKSEGALVLFDTDGVNDGNISHVGIYIGGGQYIHASSGKAYSVTISNLNDAYSAKTYVTARRVLR